MINLQPDQGDAFRKALTDAGVDRFDWYPMIRGRLVAINGKSVAVDSYADDRARRLVDRGYIAQTEQQLVPFDPKFGLVVVLEQVHWDKLIADANAASPPSAVTTPN